MNIYDLISRAQKLRKETQLDSVSPDRVGGLHEDTLKYINEFQLLASSPSLHKIYANVSAMQSDGAPKSDLTGKPLKPGQLVVIVPANQTDATAGDVYRYDGPSGNTSAWTFVAKIGAVPADAELSATSTNPPQNKVVTEKLTELESEIYGTPNLEQGGIDWQGTETERKDRVRTQEYLSAPIVIEANPGYIVLAVYYYDKTTKDYRTMENLGTTTYSYNGTELVRLAFAKTNTEEAISPSDTIIKSINRGLNHDILSVKEEQAKHEVIIKNLESEINGTIILEQGGISWDGSETDAKNRVKTQNYLEAPFSVEVAEGYRLIGIYYYNKDTLAFRVYESTDATFFSYTGHEKIRIAFAKTNTEEAISPSDDIIKEVKGGFSGLIEALGKETEYIVYGSKVCALFTPQSDGSNKAEFARCVATGLPILIKDTVDFNFDTINADSCEIVFAAGAMFKNCTIVAPNGVKINADKRKIFDKVFFWKWQINGIDCDNAADIYSAIPKAGLDRYNYNTGSVIPADSTTAVNMFINRFCSLSKDNFVAPLKVGDKYAYSSNNGNTIDFYYEPSGVNISLPIRKDYVFVSKNTGSVLASSQEIRTKIPSVASYDPSIILASKLVFPTLVRTAPIMGEVLPEWFGAIANDIDVDCKDALQAACLVGGLVHLSSNCTYWTNGDIRVFGSTKINGNGAIVKLKAKSSSKNILEIETLSAMQANITINDLTIDGNKANQTGTQNGIYADYYRGKIPFDGYSVDDTIWTNIVVQNCAGSGICVGTPGTSHIYSSKLQYNGYDGITWDYEHFTLVNVTCWGNGRHGAFASGNHWRIIGGAFAHNGAGDNIHCMGAFESQIIGCSCIDSGRFIAEAGGGYVADSSNPYGYIWAGEGQGTHKLVGGRGIYCHSGTFNMTLLGVRVNNQNSDGFRIEGGRGIVIADCQFNDNNMTKNPKFDEIIGTVCISNTYCNKILKNTGHIPQNFGSANGGQDWDNLLTTLPIQGEGTVTVSDYFNAANRPNGAGEWLEGTITFKLGLSETVYRTYIRLMDENGNQYVRYVNINRTTGVYTNDSGWKVA